MSEVENPNVLKETEAKIRCKQVASVSYDLSLQLQRQAQDYTAEVKIEFDFKRIQDADPSLFLDFVGQKIHQIQINGTNMASIDNYWKGKRIYFPNSDLKLGRNTITIKYTNTYNHDGQGFHQFVDPEDKEEYMYTNFEPFDAHKLFPCFDQPNIKARFKLRVVAPATWKVLSNTPYIKTTQVTPTENLYEFEESALMSTYLFAIVVGPFHEWRDVYNNEIPLGLYARKSLAKYLEYEEIFDITKAGLQFYSNFFNFPYPFKKYDQVYVPEFNQGAMENIGLVTYREDYVFKDPPTTAQRAYRADTTLHEMAHMWFGNLVTPVWWDGLWLNESFATYMAALCVAEVTKWRALSWPTFNTSMKEWAYREDQQSTTHPIQCEVPDTDATLLNFDGITYGKGASLLKQLVAIVGMEGFKKGMQHYFKTFQWGNTTIDDFLLSLQHGAQLSGRHFDARQWSREWLCTAGLNTLTPKYSVNNTSGLIEDFVIIQEAPSDLPTFRHHHLEIALFDVKDNCPVLRQTLEFDVLPQKETVVFPLIGQREPSFVFLNFNDYAFAKCLLDPISEKCARQYLEKFEDPLLRQMLWSTMYTMVRDHKLPVQNYLELVRTKIGFEKDAKLVSHVLNRADVASKVFLPDSLYPTESTKLFHVALDTLQKLDQDDFRIPWAQSMISFACTKETVSILVNILQQGGGKVGTYELNQKMRWSIVTKAVAWKLPEANTLLEMEKQRDTSDRGDRAVRTAFTSQWDSKVKEEAWNRYLDKNTNLSFWQLEADMSGFRWRHQSELLVPYIDKFFAVVRRVFKEREKEFSSAFFSELFPFLPEDPTILSRTENLLKELQPDEQILARMLKEMLDDLKRARKCRELSLIAYQNTLK